MIKLICYFFKPFKPIEGLVIDDLNSSWHIDTFIHINFEIKNSSNHNIQLVKNRSIEKLVDKINKNVLFKKTLGKSIQNAIELKISPNYIKINGSTKCWTVIPNKKGIYMSICQDLVSKGFSPVFIKYNSKGVYLRLDIRNKWQKIKSANSVN